MIPLTIPLMQNTGIAIVQAKNKHQFRSVVYGLIAIINIIMSIMLVKKYGAIGYAIATGISFIVGNIIIMNIYYWKKISLNIPFFWKNIWNMTIPMIGALGKILNIYVQEINYYYFMIKIVIYTIIYMILLYVIGLNIYEKKEIKKIFQQILLKKKEPI